MGSSVGRRGRCVTWPSLSRTEAGELRPAWREPGWISWLGLDRDRRDTLCVRRYRARKGLNKKKKMTTWEVSERATGSLTPRRRRWCRRGQPSPLSHPSLVPSLIPSRSPSTSSYEIIPIVLHIVCVYHLFNYHYNSSPPPINAQLSQSSTVSILTDPGHPAPARLHPSPTDPTRTSKHYK